MATYLKYDRFVDDTYRVSDERLNKLVSETIDIVKSLLPKSPKNIIAFSGGKDSIAMTHILKSNNFDISDAVCETSFMFTEGLKHTKMMAQHFGLRCEFRERLTWDWLKRNPKYVECPMKLQSNLYSIRQQQSVKEYSKANGYTGVLYGRRRDENNVPKPLYTLKNGQWQCHPMASWTTKDVWSYIHKHNISFPKQYKHEIGRKEGFSSFLLPPEHFGGSTLPALYSLERQVVERLAEFYPPAQAFINRLRYSDKP